MLKPAAESDNPASTAVARFVAHWRKRAILALVLVTPLGFATKFALPGWFPGPFGIWCRLYGAAVLYEVFWVLVLTAVAPRLAAWRAGGWVALATCFLEFSQSWHDPGLDALRRTFVGAALLGNGFDWWDFPHYALGSAAGALLVRRLRGALPAEAQPPADAA